MKEKSTLLALLAISAFPLQAQNSEKSKTVIFEVQLESVQKRDSVTLDISPVEAIGFTDYKPIARKLVAGKAKWTIPTIQSIWLYTPFLKKHNALWTAFPGDSIVIKEREGKLFFEGSCTDQFLLCYQLKSINEVLPKPVNLSTLITKSLEDYLDWNRYLNVQLEKVVSITETFKHKVDPEKLNYIKASVIDNIEEERHNKFTGLRFLAKDIGLTNQDLCNIYDSTFHKEPAHWMRSLPIGIGARHGFILNEVFRDFNFDANNENLKSRLKTRSLYYEKAKNIYTGKKRERYWVELLTFETMKKFGFTPETENLLTRYYNESGYPEFKNYVKEYEVKMRTLVTGNEAPAFELMDARNQIISNDEFRNKVVLMDFWFTGCVGCIQMVPVLHKIEKEFASDTNLVFLNISVDKDKNKWLRSVEERKYTTGTGIKLFTGGYGSEHTMLKAYNVVSYPSLYLLNGDGQIALNPITNPRIDTGRSLSAVIKQELEYLSDGPYVFHEKNGTNAVLLKGGEISSMDASSGPVPMPVLTAKTPKPEKSYAIILKPTLKNEPCEFLKPAKLFVLSDVEGNLDALIRLLQSGNVIDSQLDWIFKDGHLVFTGDMFDRGIQVTECLWLIYGLEEKARNAGGYVHFILGNHEIMNLSGDIRYVQKKYKNNAKKLNRSYTELYDKTSELGRWLRTKNIVEKIGDVLFVHGGIGKEVLDLNLSLTQLNDLARPYYDNSQAALKSGDTTLSVLFSYEVSPFWFRTYYREKEMETIIKLNRIDTVYRTPVSVIDQVMKRFDVSRIITGHTIVSDTISTHYGGKVINVDTKHASGKSEALYIEGGKFFRVNPKGERFLIDINRTSSQFARY